MEERRLQALILRKKENQFYFTEDMRDHTITVIPLDGEPFTLAPISDVSDILERSNITKVTGVRTETSLFKALAEELAEIDNLQTVGIEHDHIHAHLFKMFKHQILPEMMVNDATSVMTELRANKSEQEIKYISKACKIADKAMDAAIDKIKAGMSEIKAARLIDHLLDELGSTGHKPSIVLSGKRTSCAFTESTEKKIGEREPIIIRITPCYRGYFASKTTTIPTPADPDVAELIERYESLLHSASENLRAGTLIADYEFSIEEQLNRAGLRETLIKPLYAGIGLEAEEPPLSRENSQIKGVPIFSEFRENMSICLGSGMFFKHFGVQVRHTWLVEAQRAVKLTC
jgi:Xaa-Pro aminopeptidase